MRWFYRPEETSGGRRPFHAVRELLMSDHEDEVPLGSLIRGARVLSLAEFARAVPLPRRRLDPTPGVRGRGAPGSGGGAGAGGAAFVEEDPPTYFARLSYRPATKAFLPDRLPVFCTCEGAYCPDDAPMICCPACHEFYHPQVRIVFCFPNRGGAAGTKRKNAHARSLARSLARLSKKRKGALNSRHLDAHPQQTNQNKPSTNPKQLNKQLKQQTKQQKQCVGVSAAAADRIRREIGLPSDAADVGAPPPPKPGALVPWLCPQCTGERSRGARAR